MDPRLREAAHRGDLEALRQLLHEDSLLLDRLQATTSSVADNCLHIAALRNHAGFAKEVVKLKPGLAKDLNGQGLTPLHLASASGNLAVVKELLSVPEGSELCRVRDGERLLPIHTAASKGRVEVFKALLEASPELVKELTGRGETVLHCAVKSGCYEIVEFFVKWLMEGNDDSLLNAKDERGNTVMHLAAARRQLQTIKILLKTPGIEVNEVNVRGLTMLDVLLVSPSEYGDMELVDLIIAAGGTKTAGERHEEPIIPIQTSARSQMSRAQRLVCIYKWLGIIPNPQSNDEDNNTPDTLMVVAALIATITFAAIMSPPGGFDSQTGKVLRGPDLETFLVLDMFGLFSSMTIILLLICFKQKRNGKLTRILVWIMWFAVYSTALAFLSAALVVYPPFRGLDLLIGGFGVIFQMSIAWIYLRFSMHLFYVVGWLRFDGRNNPHTTSNYLAVKRALLVLMMVTNPCAIIIILGPFRIIKIQAGLTRPILIPIFVATSIPALLKDGLYFTSSLSMAE